MTTWPFLFSNQNCPEKGTQPLRCAAMSGTKVLSVDLTVFSHKCSTGLRSMEFREKATPFNSMNIKR